MRCAQAQNVSMQQQPKKKSNTNLKINSFNWIIIHLIMLLAQLNRNEGLNRSHLVRYEWKMLLIIRLMIISINFDWNYFAKNETKTRNSIERRKKITRDDRTGSWIPRNYLNGKCGFCTTRIKIVVIPYGHWVAVEARRQPSLLYSLGRHEYPLHRLNTHNKNLKSNLSTLPCHPPKPPWSRSFILLGGDLRRFKKLCRTISTATSWP